MSTSYLEICEHVTLHGKRVFAGRIKEVRTLRWRACPVSSGWAQYNDRGPYEGKRQERQEKEM